MAVDAFAWFDHRRRMVTLAVEPVGKLQDVLGAEFDTVATPLASIVDDVDLPPGDLDFLGVERDSLKCHDACLLEDELARTRARTQT